MWCVGVIVQVANGTTDKESPRCRTFLEAGAVRIKWPADEAREEPESFTWNILQDADWREDTHLGWRFTMAELAKRSAAATAAAEHAPKRRK
jgi:hypothetical protein